PMRVAALLFFPPPSTLPPRSPRWLTTCHRRRLRRSFMLSGRFWFSTIQSMRLSRRPRRPSFFCHRHRSFFSHHRRHHSASSCCRSRCTAQCRYGYARPSTLRRHLRITLFSRTFTTQSSLTTSIRSRSPNQVVGQEP